MAYDVDRYHVGRADLNPTMFSRAPEHGGTREDWERKLPSEAQELATMVRDNPLEPGPVRTCSGVVMRGPGGRTWGTIHAAMHEGGGDATREN